MIITNLVNSDKGKNKKTSSLSVTLRIRENIKDVSINFRLSYNGKTFDKFTGIKCQKSEIKNGKIKGKPEIEALLKAYENNLYQAYIALLQKEQTIDLERISQSMFGKPVIEEIPTLFVAMDRYVQTNWFDRGTGFKEITKLKGKRYFNHLKQWARIFFGRDGIDLTEIKSIHDKEIIKFMIAQRGAGNNHAQMHVQRFKSFFDYAIGNDWIVKNPFMNFTPKNEKVKIKYLTIEDVENLENLDLTKGNVYDIARDLFLFCCYTGLSYADLQNVSFNHIKADKDGFKYLEISRLKTDELSIIPLSQKSLDLIEKYRIESNQKLFKVPTNQQLNRLLKELGSMAELTLLPTWHLARKTFTTQMISDGIDVVLVSRMVGHSNISTTLNHYGKINEKPILEAYKKTYLNK